MTGPIFLTLDEVLQIHARSLAEHGGAEGMREPGLVDSAMIEMAEKKLKKSDLAAIFRKAANPE